MKTKLLFVITQFYKGGAEVALLNLLYLLPKEQYEIDLLVFDQMILKDAHSLLPEVPSWIHVCNAAQQEGKFAVILKLIFKIYKKITKHQLYRLSAYTFVKQKQYDVAFSYGEWMSPEFVAKKVHAKRKYIWIHTDIDKVKGFNETILFGYDKFYTAYLFVSKYSEESALTKFPKLQGKTIVVHNLCNEVKIKNLSYEPVTILKHQIPYLLSVGNLREEKNYPRQIEVMKILKDRGIMCSWLCIGSTANPFLYRKINIKIQEYKLQDSFFLLGVKENPYPYFKNAAAIVVLSDYESWSMVITEAKLLGIPIIATKTSGALEQIEDKKTGILTDFSAKKIADTIESFLKDSDLSKKIQKNLQGFTMEQDILEEFSRVMKFKNCD